MPRTSSKSQSIADERPAERAIRVEKTNSWEAVQRFFQARETRMVVGILLLTFALIATLAYVSFLFTGTSDQSILSLDRPDRLANRESIRNLLGLPGARLAQFMIDGSFGFVSILLAFMVGIYALRLMHVIKELKAVKLFCCTVFWVLWGSVVLGFAQQMVHLGLFRWGGAFGAWAAKELSSYVNTTGTALILVAALVIFLIVTDPRFIDRCRAFGQWVAGLFKRKPKPDQPEDPNVPTDVVIDLPVDTETTQTTQTTPTTKTTDEDVPLTIESGASPQSNGESGLRLEGQDDDFEEEPFDDEEPDTQESPETPDTPEAIDVEGVTMTFEKPVDTQLDLF